MLERISPNPLPQQSKFSVRKDLVALPTETVYGLAGDALEPEAVAKIFEAKERPSFDPLIIHIGNKEWLDQADSLF